MESQTALPRDAPVSFELVLRYSPATQRERDLESARLLAGERPTKSREAAIAAGAADAKDVERVRSFAERAGLTVDSVNQETRSIHVTGAAGTVNDLFHITLMESHGGGSSWRDYDGQAIMPPELAPIVEEVLGLSTRPVA